MAGFIFRLERANRSPADPPTFEASRPDWPVGSEIITGRGRLRVVGHRDDSDDYLRRLLDEYDTRLEGSASGAL